MKLGGDTIVIKRAPEVVSGRGNERSRDWANAEETTYRNCMVEPFLLTDKLKIEENEQREFSEDTWRVWIPGRIDVRYTDRIEWEGEDYEVRGLPGYWRDLNGKNSHTNIMVRKRVG